MEDYSSYLKAELIEFLHQRDTRIVELENDVKTLQTTNTEYEDRIGTQLAQITTLQNTNNQQLTTIDSQNLLISRLERSVTTLNGQIIELGNIIDSYERGEISTAMQIINSLHVLPKDEIDLLVGITRTESKGIEASIIFNYGKQKPLEKEDSKTPQSDDTSKG